LLAWACDVCLKQGRATRARPWLQEFCCDPPRFAYFDQTKTCQACGKEYVFTRGEQKRWYEEYKLRTSAVPSVCRACRAAKRARTAAHQDLAARLHSFDPENPQELVEIAALYLVIGNARKAALFLRRAKNASDDPARITELLEKIAAVEAGALSPSFRL
jgi:hypothetical protein